MNRVLVDTSIWISFFKGDKSAKPLISMIESNIICTNELILAELIPSLEHRKEDYLINLLQHVELQNLNINWNEIIAMQAENLSNGINRVGLPDLIIAQNAIQNDSLLFTLDKHFFLMSEILNLKLYQQSS
ncbi:MAG: PIN domain nuclease [Spirochaetes bacterium]|nr:MAG: PIN domain nuclease [Spirochaetota bacterium]